jgi:hypothetical protein
MEEYKICRECGEDKSFDNFPTDSRTKDGRRGICRECDNSRRRGKKIEKQVEIIQILPKIEAKNTKFNEICEELSEINKKFMEISNGINSPIYGSVNMTIHIRATKMEYLNKASELEEEYQNILHPPKNEWDIDKTDLNIPFDTMNSGQFIAIVASKLQMFIVQTKKVVSDIDICYNSGIYTFRIIDCSQSIKLKNEEINIFLHNNNLVPLGYTYQD